MGVMSSAKALLSGGLSNIRLSNQILKEVNTLVKNKPREEVSQALLSDEAMTGFAQSLYDKLSVPLKNQVPVTGFVDLVLKNRQTLMSKPRNQKKAQKK
jgi:hypothetical protein